MKAGTLPTLVTILVVALSRCEMKIDAKVDVNRLFDQAVELVVSDAHQPDMREGEASFRFPTGFGEGTAPPSTGKSEGQGPKGKEEGCDPDAGAESTRKK